MPAAPLAVVCGLGGVLVIVRSSLTQRAVAGFVVACAVGSGGCSWALQRYEAARVQARDAIGEPRRCAFHGVVRRSPTRRGDALGYVVEAGPMDCEGLVLPSGWHVRLYGGPSQLARGDTVDVVAQLAPARTFRNAPLPSPVPMVARSGVVLSGSALSAEIVQQGASLPSWIDRARARVRQRIEATFAADAVGMAKALVLGENDLSDHDDEAFRASGLSHLLAVSGTHLVFAVVALVRGLTFVLVRVEALAARLDVSRLSSSLGAPLALLYADFAGGSGSAWRAAYMLAAAFLVRAASRRPRIARVVAVSVFAGFATDPLVAFDVSFLLSLAATSGLVVLGQPWGRRWGKWGNRSVNFIAQAVLATVASMIPCAPLLALMAPSLTLAGIAANVVAGPFGEAVALPLCLSHAVSSVLPDLERGVALVASGALLVVKHVAHLSAAAQWSALGVVMPHRWHFAVLAVGATACWCAEPGWHRVSRSFAVLAALLVVEVATVRAGSPRGELRVTALDVGQGDATLLDLPDGSVMLIDGGGFVGSPVDPGERVLLPVLRSRRRQRIDVMVLSHPHPDHFGGLVAVAQQVPVGELWDTGQGETEGAGPTYALLLEALRAQGTVVRRPSDLCGRHTVGGAILDVLGPCPQPTPHTNANDNSLVLRVEHRGRSVLLMGDAEAEQERKLLESSPAVLRADVLKVGHHGSRTSSSPELLAAVRPRLATVSCGVRNRFGHPHLVTLEHLAAARVAPLRLDRTGSVTWRSSRPDEVRVFQMPQ